jgi:alpha-ribazole phosphatase
VKLWLVRHAPTSAPAGLCYGRLDLEADAEATAEATRRAHANLPSGIALRTSPARRCRQLADALKALRPASVVTIDPRLQEMDFGAWEGRTWASIGEPALARWTAAFATHAPGGGEPVHMLLDRVAAALDESRRALHEEAWITHAGVVRAARLLAAGIREVRSASNWPDAPVPFGGAECLELT